MFEAFKNLDDTLRKDAGCDSDLDYIEHTSWVFCLKYLDDYETHKATAAELNGDNYQRVLKDEYRWNKWAALKIADGRLELTGDDLKKFVDDELFQGFSNQRPLCAV